MTSTTPASAPSGRLELTWTNKHQRLLAHVDGSYEWTAASDYRVAEVRLLHNVTTVGTVAADCERARDNLLIRGDALHALTSLSSIPEFRDEYLGKIKLAYIDPPFNTGQAFEQYDDALEHSVWLTMMRDRLVQIRDLLGQDGSVWVHLDDTEVHYCRVVMDEVFGRANFISSIIWQKADTLRNDATRFSTSHDTILVFAKDSAIWRTNRLPRSEEMNATYKNPDADPRGPWLPVPLQAPGIRPNSTFVVVCPATGKEHLPPPGKCWRRSPAEVAQLIAEDRIWFGRDGLGVPQLKRYLTEVGDRVPDTLWQVKEVGGNRQSKAEMTALFGADAFQTPKPERLLQRVLQVATRPGDLVLDCFAGSATTAAVCHKMGRRWVTVERDAANVEAYNVPRLSRVVMGRDLGGVSEAEHWGGGGGFRVLDVAPSMFEVVEGRVVLADWATGGALAEAVAAQASFTFEDDAPFSGRKGRQRLAVIDGLVNEDVLRLLLPWLAEGELLSVYGTAVDPACKAVLSQLRRGSSVKRIPQSVLDDYRRGGPRSDGLDWPSAVVQAEPQGTDVPAQVGAAR